MGCGTSKSVQTVENEANSTTNGTVINKDNVKQANGTNGSTTEANGGRRMSRPMTPVPKPVAFEITLDDKPAEETNGSTPGTDNNNIPKKLPPKRLLTLAEQPVTQLTAKQLLEKQLKAEEKRLEILEERKQKAHNYNAKFLPNNSTNSSANNSSNNLNNNETNSNGSQEPVNAEIKNEDKVIESNSNVVVN